MEHQSAPLASAKTGNDLIYLLQCFAHKERPIPSRVECMDQDSLLRLATVHSLSMAVGHTLRGLLDENDAHRWKQAESLALRSAVLLDAERRQLVSFLEESGIWYMPLKGIVIKDFYPVYGTREMADNDIFFDAGKAETVHDWFVAHGYRVNEYNTSHQDIYAKPPACFFEMHRSLFEPFNGVLYDYYRDVDTRLLPDEKTSCGRRFSDEDFYIYFFAHAAKHFQKAGNGLRSLLDLYFIVTALPNLNWQYVCGELEKMGLREEEALTRSLALHVFSSIPADGPVSLPEDEAVLLSEIVRSGTLGTREQVVERSLSRLQKEDELLTGISLKWRYIYKRLFPPAELYALSHPVVYRNRWMRPFYLLWRLIRMPFVNGKIISDELKHLKESKM